MAGVSEAAFEHDDLVNTEDPPAAAETPAAETPAAGTPAAGIPATETPGTLDSADPTTTEPEPAKPVGTLPKALNPRRTPRPTKRVPGLTGRGVCALIAVVTFVGGLADMAVSGHRSHLFGVLFAITSAIGALAVRKKDLRVAMIAPPLLYCALIFVMSLIDQGGLTGGLLTREGFYLGNAFVTGAPAIWTGSLLAGAIGWYRLRVGGRR